MSVPQCLECVFNPAGRCCVKNDGTSTILNTKTPCSFRELKHVCPTCNKKRGESCDRKKSFWDGFCRVWIVNPKFNDTIEAAALKGGN